jgi:L-amino acid N-acyltransferase YncA
LGGYDTIYTKHFEVPYDIKMIEAEHLDAMVDIWNEYHEILTLSKRKQSLKSMTQWYETRYETGYEYIGIFENKVLRGFVILLHESVIKIKYIVIESEFQKTGLGTRLFDFVIKEASGLDIIAEILIQNCAALNYFILNGFQIRHFDAENRRYLLYFGENA